MSTLTPETLRALVERLRAVKMCSDEPSACFQDSGPCCGTHDFADVYVPLLREAADAIAALLDTAPPAPPSRHYADGGPCPKCGREMGHASGLGMCNMCQLAGTPMNPALTREQAKAKLTPDVLDDVRKLAYLEWNGHARHLLLDALYGPAQPTDGRQEEA